LERQRSITWSIGSGCSCQTGSTVRRQIERLEEYSYAALERQVVEKRIAWFQQNHLVSAKEIVERSPVMLEVIGGVLREECEQFYTG
jgi:hypothetical protein